MPFFGVKAGEAPVRPHGPFFKCLALFGMTFYSLSTGMSLALKGTPGPRPPYDEPRSPFHPRSPIQGPQDSDILAYAWVAFSGLIGDR